MFRALRIFLLVLILAALAGGAFVLMRSPDPRYTAEEWTHLGGWDDYDQLIADLARKHGLDPLLVKAVVWRESKFSPGKVGKDGERGLMQVTEGAASDWVNAVKIKSFAPTDLFDPKTNLDAGSWYLAQALERWKEKDDPLPFALAEYNAGRQRVHRWIGDSNMGKKATAEDLRESIDFPTTKKYVEDITRRMEFYKKRGR